MATLPGATRSTQYGTACASGKTALQTLLAQQADIITLALPHLEDICDFAAGQHLIAFLADRAGCLLAVEAPNQGRAFADSCGLRVGHYWAEDQAGTNAIALALTNAMPVQIVGPEHYVHRLHDLVTAAAPFHDIMAVLPDSLASPALPPTCLRAICPLSCLLVVPSAISCRPKSGR